jgi:diguanylate cyclase (GGDEF)-like protein
MGRLILKNIRETDFAARYGGDEFLIVLTETEKEGVESFCERLREEVAGHVFADGKDSIQLTISMGYAIGGFGDDRDARALLRAADQNLYQAKEKGRNRFVG